MDQVRLKVNLTLWMGAIRRKLDETTDANQRETLLGLHRECVKRLLAWKP